MLTEEKKDEIRKPIAEHEAKPETQTRRALEREFHERIKQLIAGRGADRTVWMLADLVKDETRTEFLKGWNDLQATGAIDPASGKLIK